MRKYRRDDSITELYSGPIPPRRYVPPSLAGHIALYDAPTPAPRIQQMPAPASYSAQLALSVLQRAVSTRVQVPTMGRLAALMSLSVFCGLLVVLIARAGDAREPRRPAASAERPSPPPAAPPPAAPPPAPAAAAPAVPPIGVVSVPSAARPLPEARQEKPAARARPRPHYGHRSRAKERERKAKPAEGNHGNDLANAAKSLADQQLEPTGAR